MLSRQPDPLLSSGFLGLVEDEPGADGRLHLVEQPHEGRQLLIGCIREVEGHFQRDPQRAGFRRSLAQDRGIAWLEQPQIHPQVRKVERLEAGQLLLAQGLAVAGHPQADAWECPCRCFPNGEGEAGLVGRFLHRRHLPLQGQRHRLGDARPLPDLHRERQSQRRAIGLERGISPVALVFQLEDIAFEANLGP